VNEDGSPPKPPALTGTLINIKPFAETQRNELQMTMAIIANTMLKTERKTRQRLETRSCLDGTYDDPDDVDPSTGKGRTKLFTPNNIRKQTMPLNCSENVTNDSRCATMRSAITIMMEKVKIAIEAWKQKMASFVRDIADSEIKARKLIHCCEY